MSADAFAKLLRDLEGQIRSATRTKSEGRADFAERLLVTLDLVLRASRAAAERAMSSESTEVTSAANALLAAYADWDKQSVDAREHLGDLAAGWSCARCGARSPASAELSPPPNTGLPRLECRACGSDTPVTEDGARAYQRLFGHLARSSAWNPAANGFVVRG
jgi:hypothetical protein